MHSTLKTIMIVLSLLLLFKPNAHALDSTELEDTIIKSNVSQQAFQQALRFREQALNTEH
jgi:hypothetical protein